MFFFSLIHIDGPAFKIRPKSVEADIDGTISLYCDVDGNPSPDILWIHEPHDRVRIMYIKIILQYKYAFDTNTYEIFIYNMSICLLLYGADAEI